MTPITSKTKSEQCSLQCHISLLCGVYSFSGNSFHYTGRRFRRIRESISNLVRETRAFLITINNMSKTKRFIASSLIMLSVVSLTSFAPVRSAFAQQTGTDVQAQIQALLAQIAALQSHIATINNTSCYTFTRDLSMGSRGDDVRALQVFLNNKGYLVAMTGAGSEGNETTTFGSLTRTALARHQTGAGIAPAVGYFGPTTRAHVHSTCTPTTPPPPPLTTPPTTTPTTTTPPRGDEGQLKNFSTISTEPDVKEGEENMRILGIEFYADDSDMRVDRVDVEFEKADGSGSNRLNRYVESLSLRLGSREIASQGVSSASRKDDVYSFRFTGLNTTVSEGGTTELYVVVDTVQNIDS